MKKQILVNLKTMRLGVFEDNRCIKEYPVGIGKNASPTPPGNYQVMGKLVLNKPDGTDRDFGSRRILLSSNRTCIHGSWNGPTEGRISGGCIRMDNRDIEELFSLVELGTPVAMVEEL